MPDPMDRTAHWFVCAVCGKRGGCNGECEDGPGDDGEHVHFRQECWEAGPPSGTRIADHT